MKVGRETAHPVCAWQDLNRGPLLSYNSTCRLRGRRFTGLTALLYCHRSDVLVLRARNVEACAKKKKRKNGTTGHYPRGSIVLADPANGDRSSAVVSSFIYEGRVGEETTPRGAWCRSTRALGLILRREEPLFMPDFVKSTTTGPVLTFSVEHKD